MPSPSKTDGGAVAAPAVSIIVPTLNEGENLRLLLPALQAQDTPFAFEVLVIDSGSDDATLEVCQQFGVRTMEIPKGTFDHGLTRLEGAREAAGDVLVFTVGDALPADDQWLANLVGPVLEDENVAGCYGMQVGADAPGINPLEQGVSQEHQLALELAQTPHARVEAGTGRVYKRVAAGHSFATLPPAQRRRLASFDNCNSCARRSLLLGEVPFDKVTFGEDYQWAAKVIQRGYTVAFEPRAKVYHYHVQNFRYFFKRMWMDQKIVREVFDLHGHRSLLECADAWQREVRAAWRALRRVEALGLGARLAWFGYNLKMISANRLARYLTEAEGRRHPMGWLANRVERRLGSVVTIRRPD